MTTAPKIMTLVGYERLTDEPTGFCTGLYSFNKENQTFVPIASVEGSGNSTVAGFRPVYPRMPHWLDGTEGSFLLAVGDPWADVLLFDDKLHFGTRPQLRAALNEKLNEFCAEYPFTAVALTSDLSGEDRREAVKAAYERVIKVFDIDHANAWVTETYFRGQILSHLRRKLLARNASPAALEAVRHIQVLREVRENSLIVTMPGSVELDPSDVAPLLSLGDDREALSLVSELPEGLSALSLRGRSTDGKLVSRYRPKPVLLVPFGKSAERICAMIMEGGGVSRFVVDANWPRRLFEYAHSYVIDSPSRDKYSLAVIVIDHDMVGHRIVELNVLQSIIRAHGDIPLLVAPTLPNRNPARSLTIEGQFSIFERNVRHMLLDTSAARTPLYAKNRAITLTRRTSLLIEQACLLMLTRPDQVDRFRRAMRGERDLCLTLSFREDDTEFKTDNFLPTEAAFQRSSRALSARTSIRFGDNRSRQRSVRTGVYELTTARLRSDGISDLAIAAIGDILRQRDISPDDLIKSEKQIELSGVDLKFPELTALIEVDIAPGVRLLVLAESPTLEALKMAARHGYHAVRYTDTSTLRRLLFDEPVRGWRWNLPDDIVPVSPRLDFETTSVFSRPSQKPGFLVLAQDWSEWVNAFPRHPLASRAKAIIPTVGSGKKPDGLLFALNYRDVANAARRGGDAWEALQMYGSPMNPKYGVNHLFLSENVEEPKVERWAFRMTSPSIVPYRLPKNCTVGDGWFVFDGDIYAAALVASKVFSAWIRANVPQVNISQINWLARQSDRILNSLPWPDNFRIAMQNAIVCISPTRELEEACAALEFPVLSPDLVVPPNRSAGQHMWSISDDQLTSAVLGAYGIRNTSSEIEAIIQICERYDIPYRNQLD